MTHIKVSVEVFTKKPVQFGNDYALITSITFMDRIAKHRVLIGSNHKLIRGSGSKFQPSCERELALNSE